MSQDCLSFETNCGGPNVNETKWVTALFQKALRLSGYEAGISDLIDEAGLETIYLSCLIQLFTYFNQNIASAKHFQWSAKWSTNKIH